MLYKFTFIIIKWYSHYICPISVNVNDQTMNC